MNLQPWQAGTSGSLKAYEPTWRDRLARVLMGEQKASPEWARLVEGLTGSTGLGNSSIGVADFVPGLGQAFQAQEAVRSGDSHALAMALIPGAKGAKAATGAVDDTAKAGIRAYHGSPHDFDRFDMSKVGTGEGGNTYGIGINLSKDKEYASLYRDPELRGREASGRLYEVNVNAPETAFLDLDKPLSEQSPDVLRNIFNAIESVPEDKIARAFDGFNEKWTGKALAYALDRALPGGKTGVVGTVGANVGPNSNVSDLLKNAGVPGFKYVEPFGLKPTNYTVFDENIIDIVKKYGIAAAASMYGMDQVQRVMLADQLQPAEQ